MIHLGVILKKWPSGNAPTFLPIGLLGDVCSWRKKLILINHWKKQTIFSRHSICRALGLYFSDSSRNFLSKTPLYQWKKIIFRYFIQFIKLFTLFSLFRQRTRRGRCPIEHTGGNFRPSVRTNERPNVRPDGPWGSSPPPDPSPSALSRPQPPRPLEALPRPQLPCSRPPA